MEAKVETHHKLKRLTDLKPAEYNPRTITEDALKGLKYSINEFGDISGIVYNKRTGNLVAGHQRIKALVAQYGDLEILDDKIVTHSGDEFNVRTVDWEPAKERAANVTANNPHIQGEFTPDLKLLVEDIQLDSPELFNELRISEIDVPVVSLSSLDKSAEKGGGSLFEKYIIPPFSVFDTRQGYWQNRKRTWLDIGLKSELGREEMLTYAKSAQGPHIYNLKDQLREKLQREPTWKEIETVAKQKGLHFSDGTSIFDPVLCEIAYKWFCPEGGHILDPFAGGSVRGVVASVLGYEYSGMDLRKEQIDENIAQAGKIIPKFKQPNWFNGNSLNIDQQINGKFDFIFSSPPYYDLEPYSNLPEDLGMLDYAEFTKQYTEIIWKCVSMLKDNRFACFCVGEVRDKEGYYRDFVDLTRRAFVEAGAKFYNEIILLNVAGSLPIRVHKQFGRFRKVGKQHQNVLVFYKGDIKQIPEIFTNITNDDIDSAIDLDKNKEE